MNAITLTLDAPQTRTITKQIPARSAKPVTQHRLELIAKAVQALNCLPSDQIKNLVEQIEISCTKPKTSEAEEDLAAKLGVDPITDEEARQLENAALENFFEWRQELLKDSYTALEVAKLLGTKSRQTPHDRLKKNCLVGIQDNGMWKFPKWQFDPTGPNGVIAGLPEVLKALDVDNFSKMSWLTQPNSVFHGLSPIQALKRGQKEMVIAEARAVGVL
ncbi:hypothetical protein SD81_022560 [Tolypothrix campylonemoides VB511288]|nr:hypothetical protein SD81_022560 [Tolypothrix campylonemoides VB511288]